jgi:endonuclease-3
MDKKASDVLRILESTYPNPRSELNYRNEFELVCAVLMSAQCTDKKVNQVTPALFDRFPGFQALAAASIAEVEGLIREVNYFRTKSKHLIEMATQVVENFGGKLPKLHEQLVTLPGVGRKTANVVLSELGVSFHLAVDTHVFRVSRRLGLTRGQTVKRVEESLTKRFPPASWRMLHHGLILHGRRVCKAGRPACAECELKDVCSFGGKR